MFYNSINQRENSRTTSRDLWLLLVKWRVQGKKLGRKPAVRHVRSTKQARYNDYR